jgi:dTDP-4-amino-4,6-dideoxygalactose transaminase
VPWYEHTDIGFNYRMSNILAALGCAQLARLPDMIETRRAHRKEYSERLAPLGVRVVPDAPWGTGNAWLTVVVFDDDAAPVRVRERLAAEGIESRPVWKPMHRQPVFAQAEASTNGTSDDLFARGLCLPSGSDLSAEDRQYIVELIGAEVQAS